MSYFAIPLFAAVGLTGAYVFVTDAPRWAKLLAIVLLVISFVWRFGMFLQVGLSVSILIYLTYLKAST